MPTTVFLDSFTGADGTAVTAHTPDTGTSWATQSGIAGVTSPVLSSANRLRTSSTGVEDVVRAVGTAPGTHAYDVEADVVLVTIGSTNTTGVYVLHHVATGGAKTYYEIGLRITGANVETSQFNKWTAGASVAFGSSAVALPAAAAGQTYRLRVSTSGTGTNLTLDAYVTRASDGFYLTSAGAWQAGSAVCVTANDNSSVLATGLGGLRFYEYQGNAVGFQADNFKVTDTAASSTSATVTESPLPSNHLGNLTVHVVGTGTSFSSSTTWTASGVSGWSVASKSFVDATHYTVVLTPPTSASPPAGATGTLTLTEGVTGTVAATATVATPTLGISPISGQVSTTPTLTLTGANTLWSSETAAGLFTVSGGTGASAGTPTVTTNTAATDTLTVGSAAGALTVTDHSTGATASFTATAATFSAGTPAAVPGPAGVSLYLDGSNGSTAPTGSGTTTYQWHRSATVNFTPSGAGGSGTSLAGATASTYADASGAEGVAYFYNCAVANTSGSGNAGQVAGQKTRAALSVAFLGDSLYYNTPSGGSPPPTTFAALLPYRSGHAYGVSVLNGGAPGSATADWLPTASAWPGPPATSSQRLLTWLKGQITATFGAPGPANRVYVPIRLGANDAIAGVTAATYGANLATIAADLATFGATPVLNYPTYGRDAGSYGGGVNTLMQAYQPRIDALVNGSTILAGDGRLWDYSATFGTAYRGGDDIHPSAAGAMLIAQQDVDTLLGLLYPAAAGVRRSSFNGGF